MHNADIAAIFEEIADLLEIEGDNPFRIRAYRNAARTLRDLGREVTSLLEKGEALTELPGIGEDLAAKIQEIAETGTTPLLGKLRKRVPPALTELLHIPGLGPKRVKALYHELDIHTLEQLHRAALDGRIRTLPGFGQKTEQHILQAIKARAGTAERFKLAIAAQYADALVVSLKQTPGVKQVVVAGSYRRARETVGDLDILVTARPGSPVIDRFIAYSEVAEVTAKGSTRASVRLASKLQVDLRVVPEESYGAALHYFTGSKAHNIAIRELGQQRGLKINEYGVFKNGRHIAGETEEAVFKAVGLPCHALWHHPAQRDRGRCCGKAARSRRRKNRLLLARRRRLSFLAVRMPRSFSPSTAIRQPTFFSRMSWQASMIFCSGVMVTTGRSQNFCSDIGYLLHRNTTLVALRAILLPNVSGRN